MEVAFFGGNFTGLPMEMQERYLSVVAPYIAAGDVQGIRCSTRPDYISLEKLDLLKRYGMRHIELGAQSTDDDVLKRCGRGHGFEAIKTASEMIISQGFVLGLQMMLGLPGSSHETDMKTARDIVALGAKETRIYPCLVVKDTVLARLYEKGQYKPLPMDLAVSEAADVYAYFADNGVKVLRVGLHPSKELDDGDCLAGPYHHNFAEMVYGEVWKRRFATISGAGDQLTIATHASQRTNAIGYRSANKEDLLKRFDKVDFITDNNLNENEFNVSITNGERHTVFIASSSLPDDAKAKLSALGEVLWLAPMEGVYPSIATHPDIFFCQAERDMVVFAPNITSTWVSFLHRRGVKTVKGATLVGAKHPSTTHYDACVSAKYLIHNLQQTDPRIMELCRDKIQLDVSQAYTRCNLLALDGDAFITSDKGILEKLRSCGLDVLYVDPHQIRLEGHDYGFFPGCCGVMGRALLVCGSTNGLSEKSDLDAFLNRHGFSLMELCGGTPTDVGSILSFSV